MKGIILAGGSGTRLYPITKAMSKQLMPVYDKPMIYYPLSLLIDAGIKEILIISTPNDKLLFELLLGDGSNLGCSFSYTVQPEPKGLAQAFILGEEFINGESVALVLGDNIFYGNELRIALESCYNPIGGIIFAYRVSDPERYGVVEFNVDGEVISIEEKPTAPKSNYAIPGLYFYDNNVVDIAKNLKPSHRGELEITDINIAYLTNKQLKVQTLAHGTAWLDTGTFQSLMQASQYVQVIEERQGINIGCIEEAAYKRKFIDSAQLEKLAQPLMKSGYGKYLIEVLNR
ncbi:MAG: glucose-1-phosphate thymidylyltransferase RfbA [Bacteroidota bacterium]|nr:glucose-1-phosphate thymidylyltransferase RfbA [Bacteroidota bacterium]